MQIELSVGLVRRFCEREREQPGFAVRKGKTFCIKQRLIRSVLCNRPLEGLKSFEPFVRYACEQGRQRSDLAINFGGMPILPFRAEAIGNVPDNLPVWPAAFQRVEHLVEPLDAPFRAREGALFFKTWTGGRRAIGEADRKGVVAGQHVANSRLR